MEKAVLLEDVIALIRKMQTADNVGDGWWQALELLVSGPLQGIKTFEIDTHKCGGELCIVCGYKEKLSKSK